jgi:single-strand DNA-binding protein
MSDLITVTGLIATVPRHVLTSANLAITSFRLASTQRRFDRATNVWVDAATNWYSVTAFRNLAVNAAGSLNKGDRVVVSGRVRIRDWESGDRTGTTVEIEAESLGHDLLFGTTAFTRTVVSSLGRGTPNEVAAPDAVDEFPSDAEPMTLEEAARPLVPLAAEPVAAEPVDAAATPF